MHGSRTCPKKSKASRSSRSSADDARKIRTVFGDDGVYFNDIGCYTLGYGQPLNTVDTLLSMGSSIAMAAAASLTLTPADLSEEFRDIDQMSFRELRTFIDRRRRNGEAATREEVEWHLRVAFPFASFVMVLLGAPIASRERSTRRSGGLGTSRLSQEA